MTYHLAFDGGGNKLKAVVYDDELNILSYHKGGGINSNFYTPQETAKHVDESVGAAINEAGVEISSACGVMVGNSDYLRKIVLEHSPECKIEMLSEGYAYLLAAALSNKGIVTISGTGSALYYFDGNGRDTCTGGYGAYIGDEGSGYYIGEHGIRAALRYLDGWGEPTMLLDLLYEIDPNPFSYFYGPKYNIPMHMKIAGFTHAVEKACGKGDKVAEDIVKDAGIRLGLQTNAFMRRKKLPEDSIIATCGGAWKTSPLMLQTFSETVLPEHHDVSIIKPKFEPIVGGIIHSRRLFHSSVEKLRKLEESFKDI